MMTHQSTPRIVTADQWKRLKRWSHRKPVFALMGEFSAGKSTLLNFLLKKNTLPTQVTATQLPPIWFSWGNKPAYVQMLDGSRAPIDLDKIGEVGVQGAHFVRIYLQADILEAVDLIDTPGISDPKISADVWQRAVGQANGVLWCTHATQAWRETERATWVSLPARLRKNSLLLVTRSDALKPNDQAKVLRRIDREAGDLFRKSILISARDAITARDNPEHADLWTRSGGDKLVDNFLSITADIMQARAGMLSRYTKDATSLETRSDALQLGGDPASSRVWSAPVLSTTGEAAAGEDTNVIRIRPARPRRDVSRRDDTAPRERIPAEEAQKLREMVQTDEQDSPADQDLKSVFDAPPAAPEPHEAHEAAVADTPDLDGVTDDRARAASDAPDTIRPDEIHSDEAQPAADAAPLPPQAPLPAQAPVQDEPAAAAQPDHEADALAASVSEHVAEGDITEIPTDIPAEPDIAEDDTAPDSAVVEPLATPAAQALFSLPETTPLSAADAWSDHLAAMGNISDTADLLQEFKTFLKAFDDTAREHHARQSENTLQSLNDETENTNTIWHVL